MFTARQHVYCVTEVLLKWQQYPSLCVDTAFKVGDDEGGGGRGGRVEGRARGRAEVVVVAVVVAMDADDEVIRVSFRLFAEAAHEIRI